MAEELKPRLIVTARRSAWTSVALLAVSGIMTLLVVEGVMRVLLPQWSDQWKMWRLDPVYARGLRPNVRNAVVRGHSGEFAFHFTTNREGLRMDHDLDASPLPGWQRALFVGDSVTFGYGVDQGESFVGRLRERFDARGERIEPINAGFAAGFTLDTEYLFTREVGVDWKPSWVIVGVTLSNDLDDLGSTVWRIAEGELERLAKQNDWLPLFLKKSALVNLVAKGAVPELRRIWGTGLTPPKSARHQRQSACELSGQVAANRPRRDIEVAIRPLAIEHGLSWSPKERVRWVMEAWQHHAQAHGYQLVVLLIPDAEEVQWPSNRKRRTVRAAAREVFADAASRVGVQVLDPMEAMRRHWCTTKEPLYFARDGHWNTAGHRFIAEWFDHQFFRCPCASVGSPQLKTISRATR